MTTSSSHLLLRGRLRLLAVITAGVVLSLFGFFFSRDVHRRQVEAEFAASARDRAEQVLQGIRLGFEDVTILRSFFEASDDVTRADFDAFTRSVLARHPYIQALEWLPEVTPRNRAHLEKEARLTHPGFGFFRLDAAGNRVEMEPGTTFYAVQFVAPFRGNEVTLGFSAEALATRQEALARALRTDDLSASGRIRLIQEPGDQAGVLVMVPVRGGDGRLVGLAQGVFRMGDLIQKSLARLEPKGVTLRLVDASVPGAESLLHEEPSPLPAIGRTREGGLRLVRSFELAGRQWKVLVVPAGGHFDLGTPWRTWAVLLAGLAFSLLLAGFVHTLLASESEIRAQVVVRTRELALEMESHERDALALRESEARFRQLIAVMGEGMWVLDAQGTVTFVNRRLAEMLGYQAAEMVGQTLFDFLFEADVDQGKQIMADRRDGRGGQYDFRFRRKDGADLWAIVTGTPVVDDAGQVVSVLGVITDITERRRQEQAQLQSQKLESLGVLAGGIAHDFNNLLTAILGNISLAQLGLSEASPAWPYLEKMELTVNRATNLTRQMLAYSGLGRFTIGPLDLNQAVQEMSHLLGVSISKKVALRYHLQEGLPILLGEVSQIQQVVMNLVTNASEAIGDADGMVSIRTGTRYYSHEELARDFPGQAIAPGDFLMLDVSDSGQGMTPEVQARIFEPFFTTKFTGRGLGLSAMQGIVRGHKGGIRVYSEPGKGSTFKLIFPAGRGDVPGAKEPLPENDWVGCGTILVADDEESVLHVAADLLRSMGFDVILAADGLEAVDRFRESRVPIRAVLMDLTMPRLGGVDTFRELKRLDPNCRVVLTSGYNQQEAVQDFLGKGLAGFVQKPFLRSDLMAAMRKAMGA